MNEGIIAALFVLLFYTLVMFLIVNHRVSKLKKKHNDFLYDLQQDIRNIEQKLYITVVRKGYSESGVEYGSGYSGPYSGLAEKIIVTTVVEELLKYFYLKLETIERKQELVINKKENKNE